MIKIDTIDFVCLGTNIRMRRISIDKTQQEVALDANITISHLSNIENGHAKPGLDVMFKISRALCCSIDELVSNDKITKDFQIIRTFNDCSEKEKTILLNMCSFMKKVIRDNL